MTLKEKSYFFGEKGKKEKKGNDIYKLVVIFYLKNLDSTMHCLRLRWWKPGIYKGKYFFVCRYFIRKHFLACVFCSIVVGFFLYGKKVIEWSESFFYSLWCSFPWLVCMGMLLVWFVFTRLVSVLFFRCLVLAEVDFGVSHGVGFLVCLDVALVRWLFFCSMGFRLS